MKIFNLFPTPVGKYTLNREFKESELKFFNEAERRPNIGNETSVNSDVLNESPLIELHSFLYACANNYFQEVYKPDEKIELYITQSWLNYTSKGQYHHKHRHPNSFISGVFYINAVDNSDRIYFFNNEDYKQIDIFPTEFNVYNSDSWWLEAVTGVLYLFPSSLMHEVYIVNTDTTRISLSFNTFIRGTLGASESLRQVILK